MAGNNSRIAAIFGQMAGMLRLLEANPFKINAFDNAARSLRNLTFDVGSVERGKLTDIEGVGAGMARRIGEFLDTGRIADHAELQKKVPVGLIGLLDVPGLGAKTILKLWKEAGVESAEQLKAQIAAGDLPAMKGLGPKTIENIKKNLAFAENAGQRVRIGAALPVAQWFVERLREVEGVKDAAYAGSLRRGRETIGDIDVVVACPGNRVADIREKFLGLELVDDVLAQGQTKCSIRTPQGMQVDLRLVEPASFGAALLYFTGSKEHNVKLRELAQRKGWTLNEYRLAEIESDRKLAGKTEAEVYKKLGLAYIPPELREVRGEIEAAANSSHNAGTAGPVLPKLVTIDDIQSELHAHTTASDGRWSIRELAAAAADRGFHTVAVTDHSKGQAQANGLSAERLEQHIEAVREVAGKVKGTIAVLAGSEVDILADGRLDYPNSLLKELDIVVASPHAALSQEPRKATPRLLKAIANPYVTIVGHPTGRLIGRRAGLSPDLKAIFAAAAERGVALELNANHYRLDLRDTHCRAAVDAGCKIAINTDAHGPADLDELRYGVLTARRAWLTKDDVVNCLDRKALGKWIASTR